MRIFRLLFAVFYFLSIGQNFGFSQVEYIWVKSYETSLFDTADGDLHFGEYALVPGSSEFYVRIRDRNDEQFEKVGTLDTTGLVQVNEIGRAHYHVFKDRVSGEIFRERITKGNYENLGKRGASKPVKVSWRFGLWNSAYAAIVVDTDNLDGVVTATVTSFTFSHVIPAGTDLLHFSGGAVDSAANRREITNVTWNAVALTKLRSDEGTGDAESAIWYMTNPGSGAKNMVVTLGVTNVSRVAGMPINLSGVDTTSPINAQAGSHVDAAGTISDTVTTTVDNALVVDALADENFSGQPLPNFGTQRYNLQGASDISDFGATTQKKATAGATSIGWTHSGAISLSISGVSYAPGSSDNWEFQDDRFRNRRR